MKQTIIKKVSTYLDHLNLKPLEFDESYSTRVQKICTVKKLMLVLEFRYLVGEYSLTTSIILEEYTLEFLESITHIFEFAWTENEFAALSIDEKKIFPKSAGARFPVSFLFGMAFAAGWTPCVGPILGTIITLAATSPGIAFNLLLAYSVGMGIPFVILGALISKSSRIISKIGKHRR